MSTARRLVSSPLAATLSTLALSACFQGGVGTSGSSAGAETHEVVRVVAANLTSGNYQSYDPGHGARILDGIDPDIVLIQEFNYGGDTDADLQAFVDSTFGAGYTYSREGGAQIPNGVISRYPIREAGEWEDPYVSNRDFAYARIDVPGQRDLWAVSVHLLTRSSSVRSDESREIVDYVRAQVPDGDYLVIGGDFNTGSRGEGTFSVLSAVVETSGPHPADHYGNGNTNAGRNDPYDHVLADDDLHPLAVPTVIGASEFPAGAVIDTRVYGPLHEIAPAQQGDSGASQMQHMAVVRDFALPLDGDEGTPDAGVEPEPDAGSAPDAGHTTCPDASIPEPDAEPQPTGGLFLNEILANEAGGDVAGEFVEIVNGTGATVDLAGFTLADSAQERHAFGATVMGPGERLVVYAGQATTGAFGFSNGGDTVTLRDASGDVVDSVTYDSSLSGDDGVSMNRSPDGDGDAPWVLHTTLSAASSSPGTAP